MVQKDEKIIDDWNDEVSYVIKSPIKKNKKFQKIKTKIKY